MSSPSRTLPTRCIAIAAVDPNQLGFFSLDILSKCLAEHTTCLPPTTPGPSPTPNKQEVIRRVSGLPQIMGPPPRHAGVHLVAATRTRSAPSTLTALTVF